jgi:hypothetical protein
MCSTETHFPRLLFAASKTAAFITDPLAKYPSFALA